ncbi:putative uncharacterized protein [Parachlamydia acanthamoebae UV-7]|uniref:Uncharacterized protein n=1 Tax=Parachlamydia acanthamoebae (strain UV7) TaxID=765952 RepID=F8KXM2_PARAV|nr:hypothetical protein [Parachlamydia acanthamoebae]CCB87398.1 putative uncharacterized protein [Parachlamydia acanthamoebae UV-7]
MHNFSDYGSYYPKPSYFPPAINYSYSLLERVKSFRSEEDKRDFIKQLNVYEGIYLYGGKEYLLEQDHEGKTFIENPHLSIDDRVKYLEILYKIYKTHELKDVVLLREVLIKVLNSYFLDSYLYNSYEKCLPCREMFHDQRLIQNYQIAECPIKHPIPVNPVTPLESFTRIPNTIRDVIHMSVDIRPFMQEMSLTYYEQGRFEADIASLQKDVRARLIDMHLFSEFDSHERRYVREGNNFALENLYKIKVDFSLSIMHEVRLAVLRKIMKFDQKGRIDRIALPMFDKHFEEINKKKREFEVPTAKVEDDVIAICQRKGEFERYMDDEKERIKTGIREQIGELYTKIMQNKGSRMFQCILQMPDQLTPRVAVQGLRQDAFLRLPPIAQIQNLHNSLQESRFEDASLADLFSIVQNPSSLQTQQELHEFQVRLGQLKQLPTSSQDLLRKIQTHLVQRILN